jgi:ribosomal protein S27E
MEWFGQDGMLILPEGTAKELAMMRIKPRYTRTGVYVVCENCGHTWERMTRRQTILRCSWCKEEIPVEKITGSVPA